MNILTTPTMFMTKEAWIAATHPVVCGIRSSDPIVAANPQWWIPEIVYGFVPHTSYLKAMQLCANANIQSIKEEIESSHVNQAYNKYVAVQDKAENKEKLAMLKNKTFYNKGVVYHWCMIHFGMFIIHSTALDTWKN